MGPVPLAFSVHNFISSVGADAGFAAIIGLAILVLLYFAHARETANLREESTALGERLRNAEAAVAQLSRAQAAAAGGAAAAPPPPSVQVTDQREAPEPAAAPAPFAPVGMGAPALASATRMIPLAAPQPSAAAESETSQPTAPPGPASPVRTQPAVAAVGAAGVVHAVATEPELEPVPVGAAASGAPVGVPGPATVAGSNGSGNGPARPAPVGAGLGGEAGPPQTASAMPRTLPPLDGPGAGRSSTGRNLMLALGALVVVAAAVALVLITSTGSSTHSSASTQTTNAPVVSRAAAFKPASVTVAVLNGTSTNELAHRVAARLATSGYREGTIATASNQTATSTVVAYLPGAKNRDAALHVARALKLTPTAVRPIDQSTQQVACPSGGRCTANVVVTVGADLATL